MTRAQMTTAAFVQHLAEAAGEYQAPALLFVGDATDVVLGLPGGGFDGPHGMTEPEFEFAANE